MVESVQSICVNAVYACAAGVGVGFVAHIVTRGAKVVSGGAKCVTALGLAGSLVIGGMVVTSVRVAGTKTNDTQQVGGDLSNTNGVGQVEGGTNGVEQVGGDDSGTNVPPNPIALPLLGMHFGNPPPAVSFVTDENISNQWRVVSVSSNALAATTFTMPPHATVWEDARDFGAGRPVDRFYFCNGLQDWGRESGRGFYSPIDRRMEIGPRMLMYGFDSGFSHWDIPDGMVESLFGYGENPFITVNAKVGADHIKKTNAEVYTK